MAVRATTNSSAPMRRTASSAAPGTTCSPEAAEATCSTARKATTGCSPAIETGDLVRGGAGTDSAQTDRVTVDAIDGVENLDATPEPVAPPADPPPAVVPQPQQQPAADTAAILPTVGKVAVVRSHGKLIARAPVSCPAAEAGGCRTALTLETAKAVKLGKVRAVLVLGIGNGQPRSRREPDRLGPGQSGRRGLSNHGKLSTRIQVSSSDAAGNTAAGSAAVGLRIPGR